MEAWRATITNILHATRACIVFFWFHQGIIIPKQSFRHFCKSHFQFRSFEYQICFMEAWKATLTKILRATRRMLSFFLVRLFFLNSLLDTFVNHIFSSEVSDIKFACATRKQMLSSLISLYTVKRVQNSDSQHLHHTFCFI